MRLKVKYEREEGSKETQVRFQVLAKASVKMYSEFLR
jgi:hypothetical protein